MGTIVQALRDGTWVTRERIRLVALAVLAASFIGFGWLVLTANGLSDRQGRPIGTDFSNVYAAGTYVLDGQPSVPFDWPSQHAREKEIFGAATPFYGWHYPPFFLFIAAPLALMPHPWALAVWQGVTFALYLWMVFSIWRRLPYFPLQGEGRFAQQTEGASSSTAARAPRPTASQSASPLRAEVPNL
jgi:hypothetical protein